MASSCSAWIVATMSPIRPAAVAFERGQQRAFAGDGQARLVDRLLVEDLVVEAARRSRPLREKVAAADDVHRLHGRGPVEWPRNRRPPIHDEGCVCLVLDPDAADVPARDRSSMSRRPNMAAVADVQVGEPALGDVPGDVALEDAPGARRPHDVGIGLPHPLGGGSHRLQLGIRRVDVGLLGGELGVGVRSV